MPISGDEIDCNRSSEPQSTMSKAELRKTHKPIMEKRRRARINHCLNEIKTLILEAMNKDPARHTKLEKADILEMAVKHLQSVQRQQLALAMTTDSSVLRKFKNGFNECATEIDRYMGQIDGVDNAMKQRVSSHLQKCINGIEQVAQFNLPGFSSLPFLAGTSPFTNNQTTESTGAGVGDQNNNPRIQIPQGIQLIPSRLPTGELALLVPNSSNMSYFPSGVTATIQNRPSAFATVVSSESTHKPLLSPPVSPKEEIGPRNPSPHGFRPVFPSKSKIFNEDHQVPQISSTMPGVEKHHFTPQPLELKTLKFPINRKLESPKKQIEPLCVITNQNERYKQAQIKEDSVNFPENIIQQGIKRKYPDSHGLLTIAQSDYTYGPVPKIVRTQLITPSTSMSDDNQEVPTPFNLDNKYVTESKCESSTSSKEVHNSETSSDMWRPW